MPLREILSLSPKNRQEEKEEIRGGSERDNRELEERGGVQVALQLTHQFTWTTLNVLKLVFKAFGVTESAVVARYHRFTTNHRHFVVLPNY